MGASGLTTRQIYPREKPPPLPTTHQIGGWAPQPGWTFITSFWVTVTERERSAFFIGPSSILRNLANVATSVVTSHIFCCLFIAAIFCSCSWLLLNIHSDIKVVSLICVTRVTDFPKTPVSTLDRKCVVIAPDQGTDVCIQQKQKLSDLQCRN